MNRNPPGRWSIGQKILCVDDLFPGVVWEWCDAVPVAGFVYTIRAMRSAPDHMTGVVTLGFLLIEITNPALSLGAERGFCHRRFVPWLATESEIAHLSAADPLEGKFSVEASATYSLSFAK